MTFAWDTEGTGLDIRHGASAFFFTFCYEDGTQQYYEFDVDPYTRKVIYNEQDIREIKNKFIVVNNWKGLGDKNNHLVIGQNQKYDINIVEQIENWDVEWPWENIEDTLIASHILASNRKHDLTSLGIIYLGINIQKYEEDLKKCVVKCRRMARSKYKDWLIAKEGLTVDGRQIMPSAKSGGKESRSGDKDKVWKFDMWLPRSIALEQQLPYPVEDCEHEWEDDFSCVHCSGHRFHVALREYSNTDSAITLGLWPVLKRQLMEQDLWDIYKHQMKLVKIISKMEKRGVTENLRVMKEMENEFREESERLEKICVNIAKSKGYSISIPKAGRNDSINDFVFNGLGLVSEKETKKGNASMDKHVLDSWENTLPLRSKELLFVNSLVGKRARDTSLGYIKSYQKFGIKSEGDFAILHPSFNITGTNTTRFSSQNPNATQISKLEKTNLRKGMCPTPDRFFVSMDAQNIELRIPAYRSDEKDMIYIFEHPKDPPYFGSYHLLVFDLLHPELFKEYGKSVKTIFEDSWYQWIKNGNFARQYGAQKKKVDETYRVPGAYEKVRYRFPKIAKLNDDMIRYAAKYGYVETVPNKSVNPRRGYPLWCSRTDDNFVLPTVPLSYHVQGSAGSWMKSAIIKCGEYLETLPDYHMILTVHDELVFDMPRGNNKEKPWEDSLEVIETLSSLMESCGDDLSIPTPVSREIHLDSWAVGIAI